MVKQNKRTCITQSGKNYAINCAIQGVRLIWKQNIWLAVCKFLWSLTNQNACFVSSFCTELTLFCTVFQKNCTALNQSEWRNFFMFSIRGKNIPWNHYNNNNQSCHNVLVENIFICNLFIHKPYESITTMQLIFCVTGKSCMYVYKFE